MKTYRPHVMLFRIGTGDRETWSCQHNHKTPEAGARCGQLALRNYLPTSVARTASVRFEAVVQRLMIWDRKKTSQYIMLDTYRKEFGNP